MEMNFFDVLWSILSTQGQFQFFVYLWLIVTAVGVFANHMTPMRVKQAASYVGITLLLFNVAFSYRILHILQLPTNTASGTSLVLSILVYVTVIGGLLTALAINNVSAQQRGWLYRCVTDGLRFSAKFVEEKANPAVLLRTLADWMEQRADELHPARRIAKLIETANSANGDS